MSKVQSLFWKRCPRCNETKSMDARATMCWNCVPKKVDAAIQTVREKYPEVMEVPVNRTVMNAVMQRAQSHLEMADNFAMQGVTSETCEALIEAIRCYHHVLEMLIEEDVMRMRRNNVDKREHNAKKLYKPEESVLPFTTSPTGAPDEESDESMLCVSISGGADYVNDMPRTLMLLRRFKDGGEIYRVYEQAKFQVAMLQSRETEEAER